MNGESKVAIAKAGAIETLVQLLDASTRRERKEALAALNSLAGNPKIQKGLHAQRIVELPVEDFQTSEGSKGQGDEPCSICLSEFFEGDQVRRLPGCNHCFHKSCIDLWLLQQTQCPLCKGKIE